MVETADTVSNNADVRTPSTIMSASLDDPTRSSMSGGLSLVSCCCWWGLLFRSWWWPMPQAFTENPAASDRYGLGILFAGDLYAHIWSRWVHLDDCPVALCTLVVQVVPNNDILDVGWHSAVLAMVTDLHPVGMHSTAWLALKQQMSSFSSSLNLLKSECSLVCFFLSWIELHLAGSDLVDLLSAADTSLSRWNWCSKTINESNEEAESKRYNFASLSSGLSPDHSIFFRSTSADPVSLDFPKDTTIAPANDDLMA